jgi:Nitrile hydratase, alpha chain
MSSHDHSHADDNHHDHADQSQIDRPGYYDMLETAVRELLIERKLIGPDEIRQQIELLDSRTPALGAKIVARAWVDAAFRAGCSQTVAPLAKNSVSASTTIRA